MIKILVNSPFQVVSAAEFLHFRRKAGLEEEVDLIFVHVGAPANLPQTIETARRLGLTLRFLDDRSTVPVLGKWRRFRLLRREIATLSSNDVLAIGYPAYVPFADALMRARCDEKWVLDEGVASVRFLQPLAEGEPGWQLRHDRLIGKVVNWLLLGNPKTPQWDKVKWFTIFAEYYPQLGNLVHNRLELLRTRSRLVSQSNDVIFLGSPLASSRVYEGATYERYCQQATALLRKCYPGCRVVYLRHRSEGVEEARVHRYFDVVQESRGPVELRWFDGHDEYPQAVGGILSTALITLAELLPRNSRIHMFAPPSNTAVLTGFRDPASLMNMFNEAARRGRLVIELLNGPVAEPD